MIDVKRYIPFLIKHKITQRQYLAMYLHMFDHQDLIDEYKKLFAYDEGTPLEKQNILDYGEIQDLIDKGFMIKVVQNGVGLFEFTDKFLKHYGIPEVITDQLLNAYPNFFQSSEKYRIPLKTMDIFKLRQEYPNAIMNVYEEHLEVMKDLKYGIDNGYINMGIEKFVASRFWNSIRVERKNAIQEEENTNGVFGRLTL